MIVSKKQVEVFFDYICPFCYRGLKHLREVKDNYPEIEFIYRATEVNPENEDKIVLDGETQKRLKVFLNEAGLDFNPPYMPMGHTNHAFHAMNYIVAEQGEIDQYHHNVYQAIFVEQKDIEDINVVLECASDCGIDVEQLKQVLTLEDYTKQRQVDLEYAYLQNNIKYVPTLIAKDKRLDAIEALGFSKEQLIEYLDSI